MKIYFSKFFNDYIFVIGGQPYIIDASTFGGSATYIEVSQNHLKNSRMHKRKEDKEVIFICTVKY